MRLVDAAAKPGKSNALNLAIRAAAGRSILFCDADDTVAPGWLAAMGRALERHDFVAARFDSHRLNPDWARAARDTGQVERLTPLPFEPWCAVAGGGTLGFHREVFEAVGGFDPAFTAVEDTDFCIRAYRAGYALRLVPDAVYYYRFRDSPAAIYRQAYVYARSEALLRRQYVTDARFLAPGPWLRLATRTARLSAGWLKHRLLGRGGPVARAERSRKLGKAIGDLGRVARLPRPPRDPGGRSAARPSLSARLFGRFNRTTVAVRTDAKLIALTFDDGPDPAAPRGCSTPSPATAPRRPSSWSARGRRGTPSSSPASPPRATRSATTAGTIRRCRSFPRPRSPPSSSAPGRRWRRTAGR